MALGRIIKASIGIVALGIAVVAAFEGYALWSAEARTPQILATYLAKPQPLSLAMIPPERKAILLKVEDPGFYEHHGVDFSSPGQGMTTITQALTKFLYFTKFQKGFAKIEQSLIARFVLDRHLGKDQQLALFLNQAYFGEAGGKSIRGFDEAARTYFGKPLSDSSEDEFIGLVGMLIGPNELRPDTAAYKERVGRIKNLLAGKCQPTAVFDPYYEACSTAG